MGSFPHELPGYRHVANPGVRAIYEAEWGVTIDPEPGLRIPNMFDAAVEGSFLGLYVQGEDIAQSDPDTKHVTAGLTAMECVVVHDLFLNETANYAHVFLPGATFLEKDGTFINAERRVNRVRKVMAPRAGLGDWEVTQAISNAMGYPMHYNHPSEIMEEVARTTPGFAGVSLREAGRESVQWPCNDAAPDGTPIMHMNGFVRGKGHFVITEYVRDRRESRAALPAVADHRTHPVAVQRRCTDPADGECRVAYGGCAGDPSARRRGTRREGRRLGAAAQPGRGDDAAGGGDGTGGAGHCLHDLPSSGHPGECGHHRVFRLGDELPGIQGDGGAGFPVESAV